MKYFAAILYLQDAEKNKSMRPQHIEFLLDQDSKGRIFARGPFSDGAGGLVIYQAESLEEAQQLAESDPYVVGGARRLELHPWEMAPRG
jgi:uncharacterized protein YciI